MNIKKILPIAIVLLALLPFGVLCAADQANSSETKLREALKNTMLQLRDAQNQVVTLQASQAESDQDKADLKSQLDALNKKFDALNKQSATDKAATEKTLAGLNAQVTKKDADIAALNEALEKWKAGYTQILSIAKTKEAERAKLAGDNILLQRTIDDRETKNAELFKIGNEILTRYEKFSLGDALAAKEPFIGSSRVKLENLVQDYQDKLLEKKVIAGTPLPAAENKSSATASNQAEPISTENTQVTQTDTHPVSATP